MAAFGGGGGYSTSTSYGGSRAGAGGGYSVKGTGSPGKRVGGNTFGTTTDYLPTAPKPTDYTPPSKPKAPKGPAFPSLPPAAPEPIVPPPPLISPPPPVEPPTPAPMLGLQGAMGGGGGGGDAIRTGYQLLRQDLGNRDRPPQVPVSALQQLKVF